MLPAMIVTLSFLLALFPALLFLRNLSLYRRPPKPSGRERLSVLIPARNEEQSIAACVKAVLASECVDLEVIVLDDHSDDRTAAMVREIQASDSRLRLLSAPPLPQGWCGKQFACWTLAHFAMGPMLCFLDADVQVERDGLARMVAGLRRSRAQLVSGFPRQITITPLERLLLPLMHFLLLGFLPIDRMRRTLEPSLGAGCGQIFIAEGDAYWKAGGHQAIRESRHDGLALPRAFRRAGLRTDLWDATQVASCRMYRNRHEVICGLLKNATEGLAAPRLIAPFTALLLLGQVMPWPLLIYTWLIDAPMGVRVLAAAAATSSLIPRVAAVRRFRQPLGPALLHCFGISILLGIEWLAFFRAVFRVPATWKGRSYSTSGG
jgi:hypothetical protein